jgi:hypothetical protein
VQRRERQIYGLRGRRGERPGSGAGQDDGSAYDASAGAESGAEGGVVASDGPGESSTDADGGATADGTSVNEGGDALVAGDASGTALDPAVPTPHHDCRTDSSSNCISVAGTYNGAAIDTFCNSTSDLSVIVHAGKWVIGCDHMNPGFARLYVPIQKPGSFAESATPATKPTVGEGAGMLFEFSADTMTSVMLYTPNFVRADLAGSVVVGSAPYRTVSGTLHGEWTTPAASCAALSSSPCASANINVTFRISTQYGSCFSNADCTSPQTCDSVADYCHS